MLAPGDDVTVTDTSEHPAARRPSASSTSRGTSAKTVAARQAWQKQKRRTTRDSIRQAGRSLLAEHDYDTITVAQIAQRAGVSQMTFFRHFSTKEDFIIGVMIDDETLRMIRAVIAEQPPGTPALRIGQNITHELVRRLSDTGLSQMADWVRLIASHPSLLAALHGHRTRWIDAIETLLRPESPPGQDLGRRMTALLLLDHLVETLSWWAARTDPDAPSPTELTDLADEAARAILDAAGPS